MVAGDLTLSTNNTQIFISGVQQIIPHENYTFGSDSALLYNIGIIKVYSHTLILITFHTLQQNMKLILFYFTRLVT